MKTKISTLGLNGSRKTRFLALAIIFVLAGATGLAVKNFANNTQAASIMVSNFADLQTALTMTGTNTITLANDITFTDATNNPITTNPNILLASNSNITINGNGFSLIRETGAAGQMLQVPATTTLNLENVTVNGNNIAATQTCLRDEGGVLNLDKNTVVENCVNSGNLGGGIILNAGSTGTINGSTIQGNMAAGGGGIYIVGGASLAVENGAIFQNNTDDINGGGAIYSDGVLSVTDTTFTNNAYTDAGSVGTGSGGAINASSPTAQLYVSQSTFINNQSAGHGGAINLDAGMSADVTVENSTFVNNTSAGNGAAVEAGRGYSGALTIKNDKFTDNAATKNGGAVNVDDSTDTKSLNVIGSTFLDNHSDINGGAINFSPQADLVALTVDATSTFSANTASTSSRISPADQSLYDTNILATQWSLPIPFNGYNNYDISYTSDLPTTICQYNPNLWADDTSCVAPTEPTEPETPPTILPPNTSFAK